MSTFELHPHGDGWALLLNEGGLVLRAEGRCTSGGSVRATVELWRGDALWFVDETVLTSDAHRSRFLEALKRATGVELDHRPLMALAQAIRTAPPVDGQRGARELQGRPLMFETPEPWPEPVDGAELLDALAATFRRFVALPDGAAETLSLWVLHTHVLDASDVTPRLVLRSPTRRCGKTTTLALLGALVARPLPAANITPAALFRAVEAFCPTLLVDEADTFLNEDEELRGLLNAGHYRPTAAVIRNVGDDHEARIFRVWAPVAIALIGRLPATLEDRAIVIPMRRRKPDERVEKLWLHRLTELEPLRRMAVRWAADHTETLRAADPEIPGWLHDRAADNWRPLLAIADTAGGDWSTRAREAARRLSGAADPDDGEAGIQLLADLREIFDNNESDELATATILEELVAREDRPWAEWSRGKPITAHGLARLLKPFGVHPHRRENWRGYRRVDFEEAWNRYLEASGRQQPGCDADSGPPSKASSKCHPSVIHPKASSGSGVAGGGGSPTEDGGVPDDASKASDDGWMTLWGKSRNPRGERPDDASDGLSPGDHGNDTPLTGDLEDEYVAWERRAIREESTDSSVTLGPEEPDPGPPPWEQPATEVAPPQKPRSWSYWPSRGPVGLRWWPTPRMTSAPRWQKPESSAGNRNPDGGR